jgi:hypothetical protein
MKKIFVIAFIFIFSILAFAQDKPLTQEEYVKMLYEVQRTPAKKGELIDAVRKRGLGFELTDGLRSLTISKSRNDAELKRTVEEAERRRENPSAAKLPSEKDAKEVLEKTRTNTLAAVEEMPDFVVKQQIARSYAYAGTNNFRSSDKLIVAVSYRSTGQEEYKLLSKNGILQQNPQSKQTYEEVGGTSSTGEFVTVLAKIFKPESETKFELVDTDLINKRPALVFDYSITRDKAQQVVSSVDTIKSTAITGMQGRIWVDREKFRVLRVESNATELPTDFPIRTAKRMIDYDWVKISDEEYLLPILSDVRLTFRQGSQAFESRNLIRFRNYQKYGTEIIILDDDEEMIPDDVNPTPDN